MFFARPEVVVLLCSFYGCMTRPLLQHKCQHHYNFVGMTGVCFCNFYRSTISILYIFIIARHITSNFANTCIVTSSILFATQIGTSATRGDVVLPLAFLPMLPNMLELHFHFASFLMLTRHSFCFAIKRYADSTIAKITQFGGAIVVVFLAIFCEMCLPSIWRLCTGFLE